MLSVAPAETLAADLQSPDPFVRRQAAERLESQLPRSKPAFFTAAEKLMGQPQPTSWLIQGLIPEQTLGGIIGPSSSGKSFLALDLSCCVATGSEWHGRSVKQRSVFYLSGEGNRHIHKRLRAWSDFREVGLGKGVPLYFSAGLPALALKSPEHLQYVIDQIEEVRAFAQHDPGLIVVDTVARAMAGANENSAEDMSRLVEALDSIKHRFNATVLCVHHTGHNAPDRARGSSALYAALDSEFQVTREGMTMTLRSTKQKDWAVEAAMRLTMMPRDLQTIGEDGKPESSLVLCDMAALSCSKEQQREEVLELHAQGKTIRGISALTGVPRATVSRWLQSPDSAVPSHPSYREGGSGTDMPARQNP